jgi:hypothetical protein
VEKYNKYVADNPKVAMIFMSKDDTRKTAEKWAAKAGMPWFIMIPQDVKKSKLNKYYTGGVPEWVLLDKNDKVVANGPGIFERSAKLTDYTPK